MSNPNQIEQKQQIYKQMDKPSAPKSASYFKKLLSITPQKLFGFESNHIMILYFVLHGLSTLQQSACKLSKGQVERLSSYIMSLYLPHCGGFTCSSLYRSFETKNKYNLPHIVFTYSALNCLYILSQGNLSKFLNEQHQKMIISSVQKCKKDNGSYSNFQNSSEADLRFVYAALSICNILQDFSIVDKQKTISYIGKCFNFDGGFGLRPQCQSHSGAIYCAVSSLIHLKEAVSQTQKHRTLRFLVARQTFHKEQKNLIGVQGRVGKLPDSCYSYWVGASICLLTGKNLLSTDIQRFLMSCYDQSEGSFAKFPLMKGDPLHTLHSNVGLKILKQFNQKKQSGFHISLQQGIQIADVNTQ